MIHQKNINAALTISDNKDKSEALANIAKIQEEARQVQKETIELDSKSKKVTSSKDASSHSVLDSQVASNPLQVYSKSQREILNEELSSQPELGTVSADS